MITFIEAILSLTCGFLLAHLASKAANRNPFASFWALCFGGAFTLTLFLGSTLLPSAVQHIYIVLVCLLALGSVKNHLDQKKK